MKYKWQIKEHSEIEKDSLCAAFGSEILAKLLLNRGINSVSKARAYLDPNCYEESRAEEIPELEKARDRILSAINKNEKITIFGDYDVDGVTSTSCLLITLRQFTDKIDYYIPNRLTEGYGLNCEAVKFIAKKNKKECSGKPLLITCDCGITNHKEIELANSLGIDVIVTDHHSLPEILPPAYAVLNPKLLPADHKLYFLPGVGVAYKLAEAIISSHHCEEQSDEAISPRNDIKKEDLLDLVTLGMIADLAPLVDENRYLVQIGLPRLANTEKVGLKELLRICGCTKQDKTSPTTENIGFGIAPRINAVGRLADAKLAVKLLTTENLLEAVQIATELEFQNRERQFLCEETLNEAITLVSEKTDLKNDKCIILAKDNWHHGVIGIVASRLLEKYSLPTILIAIDKDQNIARGSGRSIEKLNIVDALVANSEYLEKYGGHKAACGLSIKPENVEDFVQKFKIYVNDLLRETNIEPVLNIDFELPLGYLNKELIKSIYMLAPFGFGNPMPIFSSEEVEITGIRTIGKNGQHLKLILNTNNVIERSNSDFEALIWNYNNETKLNIGDKIKIAYTPKLNNYNGETFIQLEIKDCCKKVEVQKKEELIFVELVDFRGRTEQCLNLLSEEKSVIYFAESDQKNYLPSKTCSRTKVANAKKLVLLECPPDETVFLEIIRKVTPEKIYLSFPESYTARILSNMVPAVILRKLIGMLKYIASNKNSKIQELELCSALGLNMISFTYALETLRKTGFLHYEKNSNELSINISTPSRQNFTGLIEYNLFISELKRVMIFKETVSKADVNYIENILDRNKISVRSGLKERIEISL